MATYVNFRRIAEVDEKMITDLLLDIVNDVDRYKVAQRHNAAAVSRALSTRSITLDQAKQYLSDIMNNHAITLPAVSTGVKTAEDTQKPEEMPTQSKDFPKKIEENEAKTVKLKQIQQSLQQIENLGKGNI